MEPKQPTRPRQGQRQRRTTLALTLELWEQLKEIERVTGARPSVTTRRALEQFLGRPKSGASHPAA